MQRTITLDILKAFFSCRLKAYLKAAGQEGVRSDYEATLIASREGLRRKAYQKIQSRHKQNTIATGVSVTRAELSSGADYLLRATLNDENYSLAFDGLQKVDGVSALGSFHYVPALFTEAPNVRKLHRQSNGG